MVDNSRRTGAAVEAHYRFLTWLMPIIEKFPRSHKFTMGDRIESMALDVLEALIEATYTRERAQHLRDFRKQPSDDRKSMCASFSRREKVPRRGG